MEYFGKHMLTDESGPNPEDSVDYIHVSTKAVYRAYTALCQINDIDAKLIRELGEIVDVANCEKKRTQVNGNQAMRLCGVTLTEEGWNLYHLHSGNSSSDN